MFKLTVVQKAEMGYKGWNSHPDFQLLERLLNLHLGMTTRPGKPPDVTRSPRLLLVEIKPPRIGQIYSCSQPPIGQKRRTSSQLLHSSSCVWKGRMEAQEL